MKLFGSTLIALSQASHFRAGSFQFTPNGNSVDIKRTHGWRRGMDGYNPCEANHVSSQTVSSDRGTEYCYKQSGGACGNVDATYVVTDIEDTVSAGNQYCYGYQIDDLANPNQGYTYQYDGCCWVSFTDDFGNSVYGGDYRLFATINDPYNTSPDVKLPPVWYIMSGCPAQTIALNPIDADGDTVKCRWSTYDEAYGGVYDSSKWPSLSLDENTCIVTYDGTQDLTQVGVKPISIHVEDFDADGNVKSAIPVEFLATVWTPGNSPKSGLGPYPEWFGEHEHDEEEEKKNKKAQKEGRPRGRRSVPSYCGAVPEWEGVTPAAGSELIAPMGAITFTVDAKASSGSISNISFTKPIGMTCTSVDGDGKSTCTWQATADQMSTESHQVCFQAVDGLGLQTDYRCITLKIVAEPPITNIFEMSDAFLDGSNNSFDNSDVTDYGCAGRNTWDAFTPILGAPADEADKAFFKWKKCIQCATDAYGDVAPYTFDKDNRVCSNAVGTIERAACECDNKVVTILNGLTPDNALKNSNGNRCVRTGAGNGSCCEQAGNGLFNHYNPNYYCCSSSGIVREIGNC